MCRSARLTATAVPSSRWRASRLCSLLRPVGVQVVAIGDRLLLRSISLFLQRVISTSSSVDFLKKLKSNAFVGDTGHLDTRSAWLAQRAWDMEVINNKPRKIVSSSPVWTRCDRAGFKPTRTMSTCCRRSSMRKWQNYTFLHVRSILTVLTQEQADYVCVKG